MPLTYEETREYATLKGFNPDEVEVNGITGEIRPRNRIQPTMSTAKPADKPKTTGALETIARQASLSAIPSAVSLPGSIAAGSAVTTALSPLFAGGPFTGWIPPVAGLATGLGVGVVSSMAASKLQEKALEQFQGGREYLEKSAALREERPYMSVVGDVAGSLPTMKVDGKVLKDAWHALTTEGAQQGPRMLANKLATSQAAQDVLISGGVGGISSVVEDKLADKEVDIPKALLNTVLQGAVSTPREYVGRFPGLKNAPYRGQPLAEPSPAVLGVNEMTRTVRTKEAATGDEAVRVAKEIESLNSQIGELEKIRIESEAAKHTEVVTQAKIQLKELKARNEELNKILKGEEKTTTDFVASPESMEFTKAKAAQKGVEDTTFNEGGRQTVDSAEGYGSFSNDGTKIRVNTYAGTKGVKTNLPEGLQGVPTTGAHETVHAELYNVINSEISSQSRLGEQLRAAYENDPQFKEAKAKRPDANFDWNEYATIRAAQKFAKNPSNEGRSWSAERKALSNVQKGKATADDADTVLLMKWRYDNGLNAPRGAVRANPNSTTPARNSLASNVEKEIKRVEEQPNTEQLDLPMAKEGSTLTKWQRENVADFEKPNFGPETRPAQNEFRFSKPEEENNKTFERAEAYAMARRRRNVENVEEGRQTSLDTATGATVDYVRTPEGLFVLSMDTPAESQGKGGATRLLNELRRKGPVILEANASEGEGLSQAQLTEFYTKRGLRNIGGNRFVGEPIVTPSVAAKTPVAAKPVEVKAPAEDVTPIVSGQEQRVRTEGELKTSTIEGQRAFVKKHPLLADFDENGKLKFFYEPKEWRSQELADWFGVTKRNINAYAERQGKSVREIDWNTVVNENQYKPINFPRREGVRGKAVRDEDTGRPLMRERPLNEKLDMDATVSGELSNKDTYLPAIEAGVRTALFPKENSGEMARRGRTRFAVTEGQNRWGSSIQTEAYVKRVTAEVYGAMAKEGLNVRGLDDKATFDDKIFKNAARIAERMLRDDVDVLKTRNINESASTDAPRGDGRTLGDTISTSQRLVPAGERASTEGDEDLIKAVADRIAEKKAELSSQTGIVRATEAMSNERIAAAWAKILDEYEFGRVDAADVMEAAVKVSTELKLRGVPDADIKRGVLDRMRDAGIGADDSVDAQATARYSRPEGDDVDPIRTSTDQTKQGPLEKLAPQFDQVRKFDSKVADAFERAEKIKSLNEANYLNTPLVDFRKQFGGANERELKRAYDYALEKYRNPESVDETAFSEREKAMANFWNERISQPTRAHQQRLNMFVETREGLRRKAKLSESYAPEMLNDKAIDVFTKSVDSSESTRMKREWAEHVVKMSASADKPVSMEDAMNEINDFVAAIGRNGAHSADFGALTKAAGYGLPEEMRERNLMRVMQRYGRRSSRLLAKVEGLQSDEYVRGKLRLENPETGKRAEPEDGNDILTHQEVRDAMKFIDGDFEINKSPRLLAAVRVVTNSILGPLSGVRDAASIAANSLPYMRVQDLPTLITSLGDMKSAWRKSLEYGARTGAHPLDAIATPLGTDNVVNAANVVSENLRKWSGRDAIEQFNRAWTYSIGKQLANQAVLSGNKAFLKKFGTLADVKGSDGKVKWDTDIMASNFVDRVQGTYGGRGLPAVAVDGMAAPWFALARWSLEKANVTWQDVIKPAYKGENYLPLLTYSLGTWLTGEAIESLNEALQAGKKSQNANWKEIEAADGGIEQEALRLANVMQLGSFLGMTGDMVKVGADLYKGNTPRGYSVPLADFISEGVIGNMTKFSRAVQDGANPIDALQSLMNDLAKSQWQAYRVGNYWANRDEVERTNKFRDLRVYKQTTGQEVPSEVPQSNSAFRADEREFKRSTEPLDAAEKLRGVLDRFREEYKNDPAAMAKALRRLKSNSYQTFPSPQRDIADARKYYAYLTKAYGAEEADARVQDYLRQTKLNSLKSAAIPTLSR